MSRRSRRWRRRGSQLQLRLEEVIEHELQKVEQQVDRKLTRRLGGRGSEGDDSDEPGPRRSAKDSSRVTGRRQVRPYLWVQDVEGWRLLLQKVDKGREGFVRHLVSWLCISSGLILINFLTLMPESEDSIGRLWAVLPILFMAIFVASHGVRARSSHPRALALQGSLLARRGLPQDGLTAAHDLERHIAAFSRRLAERLEGSSGATVRSLLDECRQSSEVLVGVLRRYEIELVGQRLEAGDIDTDPDLAQARQRIVASLEELRAALQQILIEAQQNPAEPVSPGRVGATLEEVSDSLAACLESVT